MTHTYTISGMTCNNCVDKVKNALQKIEGVQSVDVQLDTAQATIHMQKHVPTAQLQAVLSKAGSYIITDKDTTMQMHSADQIKLSWFTTYKPVLLLFAYITIIAVISSVNESTINIMKAMQIFMAGFFLAFSFFKMLDLRGFSDSYATYDIIAKRFYGWGFIYAFIELILGLLYAINIFPFATNVITVIVMSISLTGVLQSVLNKKKIRCACLGTVFNLPMSTITIIEDGLMIVMGIIMIFIKL